ncbi:ATP-binding cassette domain-containing protein [bacterium AH-315-I07]|nr:ATP-binding cassette domain-containing protein [bacterium AH-315-I07]
MDVMTGNSEELLLSCVNLNFSHREKHILDNVSLEFRKGEFVALLGKNGAGKSTLLSCLLGILPSQFDHLELSGIVPTKSMRTEIARKVSFVPQEHDDMFPFAALDVVVMGRTAFLGAFGAPTAEDYQLARDVLEELYVSHLESRVYNTLSGGEKQLILLARALVQTRTMILLDEPTNHLDYKNRYHILAILKKQCIQYDSCVVACLHEPNHAALFADRVILLDEGRIVADGETAAVMTNERLSRLYGIAIGRNKQLVEPCFSQPSFAGKVLLLVGASGEGKTTTLQRIIENNREKRFSGLLCPGTWKNGRRYSSTARCIRTGKSALFAVRQNTNGNGPFIFSSEGQELAEKALAADKQHSSECIIVDEVGPLELRNAGYAPHLAPLLSLQKPLHIWAVRPDIVEHVCAKWMLVDPVIVPVTAADACSRIQRFLDSQAEVNNT